MTAHPTTTARSTCYGRDGLRLRADEFGDPDGPAGGAAARWRPDPLRVGDHRARCWPSGAGTCYRVDLRGHGESDWPDDGDYGPEAFAGDVHAIATALPEPPVLVGASLGGIASMVAIGTVATSRSPAASCSSTSRPRSSRTARMRIGAFMSEHIEDGFGSLDEVADAVAAYNPHRPRPTDLSGLKKNVRQREDGRWVWHWDPRFMSGQARRRATRRVRRSCTRSRLQRRGAPHHRAHAARARPGERPAERGGRAGPARLVPHAEYVDVEGAGHMVAGDKNDLFNDAIVGFLDRSR